MNSAYNEYRRRQLERRGKAWAKCSEAAKRASVHVRAEYFSERIRTTPKFVDDVQSCRYCGIEPEIGGWPTVRRCICGESYAVDKGCFHPDGIERVYRMIRSGELSNEDTALLAELHANAGVTGIVGVAITEHADSRDREFLAGMGIAAWDARKEYQIQMEKICPPQKSTF